MQCVHVIIKSLNHVTFVNNGPLFTINQWWDFNHFQNAVSLTLHIQKAGR